MPHPTSVAMAIDALYRQESGRVRATLVRLLGDFDLADEALHEAFAAAVATWPQAGIPARPRPWLVSTARFKAIDVIRRRARHDELASELELRAPKAPDADEELEDDRLRLIFTCCHPQLAAEAQVALTLREVCGLTTEAIARAFLIAPATLAQRLVRAKARIREQKLPYEVPAPDELAERLDAVLKVVYLVFNEGYSAHAAELAAEAIRLGRLLVELAPGSETVGLLALMLLQDSRRAARTTPAGDVVLLEDQDRRRWDRRQIVEGVALAARALAAGDPGPYALQAALAATHAEEPVDWAQAVAIHDALLRVQPSPVGRLNRAVAIGRRDGPAAGLRAVAEAMAAGGLDGYHLAHAAQADLYRRAGLLPEARKSYEAALALAEQEADRRFLADRLRNLF